MTHSRGSYYVEALIAISLIGILSTAILPVYPQLIKTTQKLIYVSKLMAISNYVGNYIQQWATLAPNTKLIPFSFYTDGTELNLTGEKRINRFQWTTPPDTDFKITDHYKASIQLWETTSRQDGAVIQAVVWYDSNLNTLVDPGEFSVEFSTMVTQLDGIQ